jgi:hypothetical protein
MADYGPQGYGGVLGRVNAAADYLGNYANDLFAAASDAIFGPRIELTPVYDEKMVSNEYSRLLGGGADLGGDYGFRGSSGRSLDSTLGNNLILRQDKNSTKKVHKGRMKFKRTDRKSENGSRKNKGHNVKKN